MKLIILYYYTITKLLTLINSKSLNQLIIKKRLRVLINFLTKESPFYQNLKNKVFTSWPVISKSEMLIHFNDMNTLGIKRDEAFKIAISAEANPKLSSKIRNITIGLSSGTSNVRGLFLASALERASWTGIILAKCLPKAIYKKQKVALFLRANSDLYSGIVSKTIEFRYYSLDLDFKKNINDLGEFNPDVIVAPPSSLRLIADAKKNKHITLSPLKIISAAEVLDPIDEKYIESIFSLKLHQIYQCTEGFLAATCDYGTLHLNEDFILVEKKFIDQEQRKFIPIITDTLRTTQPIVKFQHNDILTLKKIPSLCQSPHLALEFIEGRIEDIFYLKNSETQDLIKFFPETIRNLVYQSSPESIIEFKILQHSFELITISLISSDLNQDFLKCQKSLLSYFENNKCTLPIISQTDYLQKPLNIKLKRVESNLNLPIEYIF